MKYLRIKNYERYQHYTARNPPWIKLYKSLLTDHGFLRLDVRARYLYICLLILASETENKVVNDPSYLSQRLFISPSDIDLKPLFRGGFLLASDASVRREEKRQSRDRDRVETESASAGQVAKQPPSRRLSDEEFLAGLKTNPAYAHLNLDHELGKMDAWLSTKPGKQKTRRFIVNWLNRIEKPLSSNGHAKPTPPPFPPSTDPIARNSWRQAYGDPKQYGY